MPRRLAREIALQHGGQLPAFHNRPEAEQYWLTLRDRHLALLAQAAHKHPQLNFDYAPSSLVQLERYYFHLHENDAFESFGITRETYEVCMAMYFGETVVRNTSAQWVVEEYLLVPGRYELGVRRGHMSMMLSRFTDHFRTPNNKRKQSLLRRYNHYFA